MLYDGVAVLVKPLIERVFMRPSRRHGVNKQRSARQFRRHSTRTKGANVGPAPMRGGIRL